MAWYILQDILVLLLAAFVLGGVAERLRQSAVVGYIIAGMLVGPNVLGWAGVGGGGVDSSDAMAVLAEMGVSLLLFSIGLEFSFRRLRSLGAAALGGGALQVGVTLAIGAAGALAFGVPWKGALAVGAALALSSTACVLRILASRAAIDSVHGRASLGVLLFQDLAVVPLVLMVSILGSDGGLADTAITLGKTVMYAAILVGAFYVLFNHLAPWALGAQAIRSNRDLSLLLAITAGLGSAWAAHAVKLSPAMGAFLAGLLLAESPFAAQVRADVGPLRTLLMTLFFTSIGMLGDPAWIAAHLVEVAALSTAIVVGKGLIVAVVLRRFGLPLQPSLAAGMCLAQIGEFSFVLSDLAADEGLISADVMALLISSTIVTLVLTPYLVTLAPQAASAVSKRMIKRGWAKPSRPTEADADMYAGMSGHVILVGFGPAGQAVGEILARRQDGVIVVDMNVRLVRTATERGFKAEVGDATQPDFLDHLHLHDAAAVIVTIPDPAHTRLIIQHVKSMAPDARIVARARYHVYRWELEMAGAHIVIDEEEHVGRRLATAATQVLGP